MVNKSFDPMANHLMPLPREVAPQDVAAKALFFFVQEKLKLEAVDSAKGIPFGKD